MGNEKIRFKTEIDWLDVENDGAYIRGHHLVDLMQEKDFLDIIYLMLLNRHPTKEQKKVLNAVLIGFSGGMGIQPPTVLVPRIVASTKAPVAQCLAAGMAAAGESHASAVEEAMKMYIRIKAENIDCEKFVENAFNEKIKLPGFGHPVFKRDPRPPFLLKLAEECGIIGEYTRIMMKIEEEMFKRKGIHANVDGATGAILLDLGFTNPKHGPSLFLLARTISMAAHVIEESTSAPWDAWTKLVDHDSIYESYSSNMRQLTRNK